MKLFQISIFFQRPRGKNSVVKFSIGNKSSREELVFKPNPFEARSRFLFIVTRLAQMLYIVSCKFIIQGTISLLKHTSLFLTAHFLVPNKIPINSARRNYPIHIFLPDIHFQHIAVFRQRISNAHLASIGKLQCHIYSITIDFGSKI